MQVFVLLMLTYLAASIPPLVITLRSYIDFILAGSRAAHVQARLLALTVSIIGVCLTLAWQNPSLSEKAFAFTGATGVCIVCYVIPVLAHFRLMFRTKVPVAHLPPERMSVQEPLLYLPDGSRDAVDAAATGPGSSGRGASEGAGSDPCVAHYMRPPRSPLGWLAHVVAPLTVLVVGCVLSGLALVSAIRQLRH